MKFVLELEHKVNFILQSLLRKLNFFANKDVVIDDTVIFVQFCVLKTLRNAITV